MAKKTLTADEAIKALKGNSITVQLAKPVEKDVDGKKVTVMQTRDVPLREAHITGAVQDEAGRVTITTVDGKKHEAQAAAA